MKMTRFIGIVIATATCLNLAHAGETNLWEFGWANAADAMAYTQPERTAFAEAAMHHQREHNRNRFVADVPFNPESVFVAEHLISKVTARLEPLPGFQGGGRANYLVLDEYALVQRVLNIKVRLRLIRNNGAVANEALGLTADNADDPATLVSAYFRTSDDTDFAICDLEFSELIFGDDGVALYAAYALSLKQDSEGLINGMGSCAAIPATPGMTLPAVEQTDMVDIAVTTAVTVDEIRPVLMGGF